MSDPRIGEVRTYESEYGLIIMAGSALTLDVYAAELAERFDCGLDLRSSLPVTQMGHGKIVAALKRLYLSDGEFVLMPKTRGKIVAEVDGVSFGPEGVKRLCEVVLGVDRRLNYRCQWSGKPAKMGDGREIRFYAHLEG